MGWDPGLEIDLNLDDLLMRVRYTPDAGKPHIVLETGVCGACDHHSCLYVCPVRAYRVDGDQVTVQWERCMECGACLHVCDRGGLTWGYPRGGFGVCYRLG